MSDVEEGNRFPIVGKDLIPYKSNWLTHIGIETVEKRIWIINWVWNSSHNTPKHKGTYYLWTEGTLSELTSTFSWLIWCNDGSDTAEGEFKPKKKNIE